MADFFNNIWNILSTPNQMAITIISIPLVFVESALLLYFFNTILNLNVSRKGKLLYIIGSSVLSNITLLFIDIPFNIFFNYVGLFIIIHFAFKMNLFKTILATVLPTLLFVIMQSLLFNPYITLLHITSQQLQTIPIYRFTLIFITYAIVFILTFIIKHRNWHITLLDDIDKKSKSLIIFNLLFGLFYIIIELIITFQYIDIFPMTYTFANFLMLLLYFCISLYSISRIIKLTTTTQALESAEEYNKTLRILHDNVRGFKHDFDNIVTTIGGYVNTDDMEGLKNYYVQLQQDCAKVNNLYILNPTSINNPRYLQLINF